MKKIAWAVVVLMSFAVLIAGAFGGTGVPTPLGKSGAVGKKAHAVVVVPRVPDVSDMSRVGSFLHAKLRLTVQVFAQPRQRVAAGWVMLCQGAATGRNFKDATGRTPLSVDVDLQPGNCRLTADATLSKRGRVTVRVVIRAT